MKKMMKMMMMMMMVELLALVLFCCGSNTQGTSGSGSARSECDWFRVQQISEQTVRVLEDMGGRFPVVCLKERVVRLFPNDLYQNIQAESSAAVALETVRGAAQVFAGNVSSVSASWTQHKLRLFRNLLTRQDEKLQKCVAATGTDAVTTATAALTSFTDKLTSLLTQKGYSACAWEVARRDVRYVLEQLKKFLDSRNTQAH